MVKTTYILEAFSTDGRESDGGVRYRDFTTSEKAAEDFASIPRIQFPDSGHGIEFRARAHDGGKRGKRIDKLGDHVREQLAIIQTRKTPKGALAIASLERRALIREEFRMSRQTDNDSMAARYVDDVQVLQRLGAEAAGAHGITREQIRADHLSDERITTEVNTHGHGPYSKWIHFPDGSDAGQVRGSKRWEVWR